MEIHTSGLPYQWDVDGQVLKQSSTIMTATFRFGPTDVSTLKTILQAIEDDPCEILPRIYTESKRVYGLTLEEARKYFAGRMSRYPTHGWFYRYDLCIVFSPKFKDLLDHCLDLLDEPNTDLLAAAELSWGNRPDWASIN